MLLLRDFEINQNIIIGHHFLMFVSFLSCAFRQVFVSQLLDSRPFVLRLSEIKGDAANRAQEHLFEIFEEVLSHLSIIKRMLTKTQRTKSRHAT
jgi:hypothetical protein